MFGIFNCFSMPYLEVLVYINQARESCSAVKRLRAACCARHRTVISRSLWHDSHVVGERYASCRFIYFFFQTTVRKNNTHGEPGANEVDTTTNAVRRSFEKTLDKSPELCTGVAEDNFAIACDVASESRTAHTVCRARSHSGTLQRASRTQSNKTI